MKQKNYRYIYVLFAICIVIFPSELLVNSNSTSTSFFIINQHIPYQSYLPSLTQHSNFILQDQTMIMINWTITAEYVNNTASFTILLDSILINSSLYSTPNVNYTFNLSEGNHLINFNFDDGLGNNTSDSFQIYINFKPTITPLTDIYSVEGASASISWNVTDNSYNNSAYYILYQDSLPVQSSSYYGQKINYTIPALLRHIYLIELTVYDGYGGNRSRAMQIIGNDYPLISNNLAGSILNREIANVVTFSFVDILHASPNFDIRLDGGSISSGSLEESQTTLSFNVPSVSNGIHKLEVRYIDNFGLNGTNIVYVINGRQDMLTKYADQVVFNSSTLFTWAIKKGFTNQGYYTFILNSIVKEDNKPFLDKVEFANASLNLNQNHTIVFLAQNVGNIVDYNIILLIANQAPVIQNLHAPIMIESTTQTQVNWTIADLTTLNPSYAIYIDGVLQTIKALANGTEFTINFDLSILAKGTHNLKIVFLDGYGKNITEEIAVFMDIEIQSVTEFPLWATIAIIAGAVGAIVIVFLVIRSRKKKQQTPILIQSPGEKTYILDTKN